MKSFRIADNLPWVIILMVFGLGILLSSCSVRGRAVQYVTQRDSVHKAERKELTREIITRDTLVRIPRTKVDTILILDVVRPSKEDTLASIQPVVVEKKVKNAVVRATVTKGNQIHLECETEELEILIEKYRHEITRLEEENTSLASSKQICPPCEPRKVHWTYLASRWIVIIIIILLFIGASGGSFLSRIKRVVFGIWKI